MSLITLTTVGYREVHPLGTSGRLFTMSVMVIGVAAVFSLVGVLAQLLVSGELGEPLRRRRMRRRIEDLSSHYVICAYGRVGRAAGQELARRDAPFVVCEVQEDLAGLMEEDGVPYIVGDPTSEAVLREAGFGVGATRSEVVRHHAGQQRPCERDRERVLAPDRRRAMGARIAVRKPKRSRVGEDGHVESERHAPVEGMPAVPHHLVHELPRCGGAQVHTVEIGHAVGFERMMVDADRKRMPATQPLPQRIEPLPAGNIEHDDDLARFDERLVFGGIVGLVACLPGQERVSRGKRVRVHDPHVLAQGRQIGGKPQFRPESVSVGVDVRGHEKSLVAIDGVYSMSGALPPLADLNDVALRHDAVLYVDDAHGTGVLGRQGRGTVLDALGNYDNTLVVGSLSKAFSCFGGFIGCTAEFKHLLKVRSNTYIFGGPVPPPYLDAICTVCPIRPFRA